MQHSNRGSWVQRFEGYEKRSNTCVQTCKYIHTQQTVFRCAEEESLLGKVRQVVACPLLITTPPPQTHFKVLTFWEPTLTRCLSSVGATQHSLAWASFWSMLPGGSFLLVVVLRRPRFGPIVSLTQTWLVGGQTSQVMMIHFGWPQTNLLDHWASCFMGSLR